MQTKETISDKGLAQTHTPSPISKTRSSPDFLLWMSYMAVGLVNFATLGDQRYFQLPQVLHDFVYAPWSMLVNVLPFCVVVYQGYQRPMSPSTLPSLSLVRKPTSAPELLVWASFVASGLMALAVWANDTFFILPPALSSSLPGPLTTLAILYFHTIPVCLIAHWESRKDKHLLPRSEPLSLRERLVFLSFIVSSLTGLAVWANGTCLQLPKTVSEFLPSPLLILTTLYLHMMTIATFFTPQRVTEPI